MSSTPRVDPSQLPVPEDEEEAPDDRMEGHQELLGPEPNPSNMPTSPREEAAFQAASSSSAQIPVAVPAQDPPDPVAVPAQDPPQTIRMYADREPGKEYTETGLEIVDPKNDDRVFAILDEACNRSCHTKRWADHAARAFERKGIPFGPLGGEKRDTRESQVRYPPGEGT